MKKIFLSQPMNGRSERDIIEERNIAMQVIREHYFDDPDIQIVGYLDKALDDADALWYLGNSILELRKADFVFFISEKCNEARGCIIERKVCKDYGIPFADISQKVSEYSRG